MKKISKEKLVELYEAYEMIKALDKHKVFDNIDIVHRMTTVQKENNETFHETAVSAAMEHEDAYYENLPKMLRLEVLELITILELILAAKNPKKVIDTINYYYDFPGQTSLTEILEKLKRAIERNLK